MRSTKFFVFLTVALCINARVVKRQKKITRLLSKLSPACGCQVAIRDIPTKPLESTYGCLGTCGCPSGYGCLGDCGCLGGSGCLGTCGCPSGSGCPGGCGCPNACGSQNIFLEQLPCNYGCDGYGILNGDVSSYERIPAIRLPKTLAGIDAGIPVPAINLPALYQCDVPSCQCQNLPYQILDTCNCKIPNYEFLNPVESMIQTVVIETPQPVMKLQNCGCQRPRCQRPKCGCQSVIDVPCTCQMPLGSCESLLNLPCGCQMAGLDCGCQAVGSPCGCQLPVLNVPYAYQLPSSELPVVYQLPAIDITCGCQSLTCGCQSPSCGCQSPNCGCQSPNCRCQSLTCGCQSPNCGCQALTCGCQSPNCGCQPLPPVVGCGKYLRQVTLQPPFL